MTKTEVGPAQPTNELSNRVFGCVLLAILLLQFAAGLWHIGYPFVDGRIHYNWNPPFWLMHAKSTNDVGIVNSAFGIQGYRSHPQLLGPVMALWTRAAGYSEASIRVLSLILSVLGTLFLALAGRNFFGNRRAIALAAFFACLPMIYIYGRMFNQEVLVTLFLAIQLWGFSLIEKKEKLALMLVTVGSLGMTLSDWSGFVFAAVLAVATLLVWKWSQNRKRILKIVICSWTAAALGLVIFAIQDVLQSGPSAGQSIAGGYYQLWQYRAGLTESFSWIAWLNHQISFFSTNYSIPLLLFSLGILIAVGLKRISYSDGRLRSVAVFALAVLLGQVIYNLVVPQASGIHIYFQYFFSVPVAFGMVFLVEWIAENLIVQNRLQAWIRASLILVGMTAGYAGFQYYTLLFNSSGVDITDIELIKSLKDFPASSEIIAVNANALESSWYENPNIEYYAARPITTYLVDGGFPPADYLIAPLVYSEEFLKQINELDGFGKSVTATVDHCSKNICLLHLTK